jgi:zinc finger CCHC domain-containing protein 8
VRCWQPDSPDLLYIPAQIALFATYVLTRSIIFIPYLIISQVAKSELARIRQTVCHPVLRRIVLTLLLQRDFQLDVVNIHDPGQERWKKKYVWWIPALHIDGKEVAKGRWDAQTVIDALDKWQSSCESQESAKKQL